MNGPALDHLASATILVVDDSEAARTVFGSWLRRAGATVHEAQNGADALDLIARVRVDLILLDVHLPDMSGFDVCDQVKSNRATAAIPVLHVSATATRPRDRSAGLNRGADGYLIEPVERGELLATVTSLLRYREVLRTSERLAARLERLHQATLLMNAAATVSDLIMFAATGLTELFAAPAAVLVAREGYGRVAQASPNQLDPVLHHCLPQAVLAIAEAARGEEPIDLAALAELLGVETVEAAHTAPIMTPRGELVGAAVLLTDPAKPEDELLLDHFSQALAVAFENQRIYDVEHQIALTLQHAMLPQTLPRPAGVDIAVRYQAASETVEIGGDFYEVITLDEDRTLLAIGDVLGHSLQAATVMAELRYSLRAFAQMGVSAGDIIVRLNRILCESHPRLTATLCVAVIDTATDQIVITNAGHVPPLIAGPDGVEFVEEHGALLGLRGAPRPPTVSHPFGPGALVVLATDGLMERRDENVSVGLQRLHDRVARHRGSLEQLCEVLIQEVGAGVDTFDDIAIITARRPI